MKSPPVEPAGEKLVDEPERVCGCSGDAPGAVPQDAGLAILVEVAPPTSLGSTNWDVRLFIDELHEALAHTLFQRGGYKCYLV